MSSRSRPRDSLTRQRSAGAAVSLESTLRDDAGRAGFSLLEVLIAMMVLSVGAASVLSLFAAAAGTHKRSQDRTQAALVAERLIAEVGGRYTAGCDIEELSSTIRRAVPEYFGEYRWELRLVLPESDRRVQGTTGDERPVRDSVRGPVREQFKKAELLVRVDVRWKRSGQGRSESFATILLPRNAKSDEPDVAPGIRRGPLRARSALSEPSR